MKAPPAFSQDLKSLVGQHLEISINDNRSTMLSVRWEPERTKVSLHRIFLGAPLHVRKDLVRYLRREKRAVPTTIKAFIEENISGLDYSHMIADSTLSTKGQFFNLDLLYKKINKKYFNNELKLLITWFGESLPQNSSRCSLGLYYDAVKLVKVHRLLDAATVPSYVVEYIIYHEMVHAICPGFVDERGINRVHSREFKEAEQRFERYKEAICWLNENKTTFFRSRGPYHGRAQ